MQLSEFCDYHLPALFVDQVRHNLIISILTNANAEQSQGLLCWTLGEPGCCAVKSPGRAIVLGALNQAQCRKLATEVSELDFPAVLGPDGTATWFVERATDLGLVFEDPIPQKIHTLSETPIYPGATGHSRPVTAEDAIVLADWITAFHREAVPHDSLPRRADLEKKAAEGRHLFWIVDGIPVSLAGIARRISQVAAIAPVYTPPHLRGRGYAGSVTAAVVDRIYTEGKKTACLYTDLRNPYSNRCYAKIGFRPFCDSHFYLRQAT